MHIDTDLELLNSIRHSFSLIKINSLPNSEEYLARSNLAKYLLMAKASVIGNVKYKQLNNLGLIQGTITKESSELLFESLGFSLLQGNFSLIQSEVSLELEGIRQPPPIEIIFESNLTINSLDILGQYYDPIFITFETFLQENTLQLQGIFLFGEISNLLDNTQLDFFSDYLPYFVGSITFQIEDNNCTIEAIFQVPGNNLFGLSILGLTYLGY